MQRRRFLALLGVSTSGLALGGTAFLELPRKLVLAFGNRCSFCERSADLTSAMAGTAGGHARICRECVALGLEILAEEEIVRAPDPTLSTELATADDIAAFVAAHGYAAEREELTRTVTRIVDQIRATPRPPPPRFGCSFCDAPQAQLRELVAGPVDYICDGCIGDAATVVDVWRSRLG